MKAISRWSSTLGDGSTRRVAGTVFSDGRPRLIQIKDINLDAEFAPHMLYIVNEDKPGFIGKLGTMLGDAKVNIANFTLGRSAPGQDAICPDRGGRPGAGRGGRGRRQAAAGQAWPSRWLSERLVVHADPSRSCASACKE